MDSNSNGASLSPSTPGGAELSEREREILRLVATGASNKQIAQQLVISPNTVKVHLRNIFSKIGAASRTEATLYAIREGLVRVAPGTLPSDEDRLLAATTPVAEVGNGATEAAIVTPTPNANRARRASAAVLLIGGLAITAIVLLGYLIFQGQTLRSAAFTITPTAVLSRWQRMADMPTARSSLAAATYGNQIYVMGGKTATGVSKIVERYNPATNTWTALAPMPLAVGDVQAVVIGGLIYVPGGRTADGNVTDILAVYDPRQDQWSQRAHMPKSLSGYALVAFEGRLLLFGGWDGTDYQATVYAYSPAQDTWTALTNMPIARAYAGAAVAAGKVYVIGGANKNGALSRNDEYSPENEGTAIEPWRARAQMPATRFKMGTVSLADIIHVVGGDGATPELTSLKYFPQGDQWQAFEAPPTMDLSAFGLAVIDTKLHLLGGQPSGLDTPSSQHLEYQAIFTIEIPILH